MNHKISTYILVSFLFLIGSVLFVTAGISPITPSLNLDGQGQFTIKNYNMTGNNINWTDLHEFPVACPAGSYITQLGDSVTCTEISNVSAMDSINNIQYVDPALSFKDGVDEAHTRCGTNKTCRLVFPSIEYTLDENVGIRPNTYYDGAGVTIKTGNDWRVFTSSDDGILKENIKISGFTFIDTNISAVRDQPFISFINSDFYNVEISNNNFINRSGRCISIGHSSSPIRSIGYTNIHHNIFLGTRNALGYSGDYLNFNDNYLDSTGSAGPTGEKEGIDWNTVSDHPNGTGVGSVSRNIVINFTEQGLDINAHRVVISENYIIMRPDGGTTTGINSYNNRYGVVSNNIIEMTTEINDNGMKIFNSYNENFTDAGQIVIGNKIIGKGYGTGFRLFHNNNIFTGNSIQNLTTGLIITGNNTQMGLNHYIDVTTNIDDNGVNNSFKFNSVAESDYNISTTSWLVGSFLKIGSSIINNGVLSGVRLSIIDTTNNSILDLDSQGTLDTLFPFIFKTDVSGLQIQQGTSINGSSPYFTADFPILDITRASSSRGASMSIGNSAHKNYIYGSADGMAIYNEDEDQTFRLGMSGILTFLQDETIDNIVDGWLRITGGLNVTGNVSINNYYAEISGSGALGVITTQSTYANITNITESKLNGFTYDDDSTLTSLVDGLYQVNSQYVFSGTPNNEYHLALAVNGVRIESCHTERKLGAGGDVGSASITCLCPMAVGDIINIQVENINSTDDAVVRNVNLNMVRIAA